MWHEQVACWAASVDKKIGSICTSDGDVYNQDMAGGTMATHIVVPPPGGARPGHPAPRCIYGFTHRPTSAEMLGAFRRGRVEAVANVASEDLLPMLSHILMWGGRSMTLAEAGLVLPPARRLATKVFHVHARVGPRPPAAAPSPAPELPLVTGGERPHDGPVNLGGARVLQRRPLEVGSLQSRTLECRLEILSSSGSTSHRLANQVAWLGSSWDLAMVRWFSVDVLQTTEAISWRPLARSWPSM